MDQRFLQRQIARTSSFEIGRVDGTEAGAKTSVQSAARPDPRTGLYTILAQGPLPKGSSVLMLAGGDNDRAVVLGLAPFVGG